MNVADWTDIVAVSSGVGQTVDLREDGTVVATGDNYSGQINVSELTDIVSVSAGCGYTVGIKNNGAAVEAGNAEKIVSEIGEIINAAIP